MKYTCLAAIWFLLSTALWASPPDTYSIDGVYTGQTASSLEWPTVPKKDGQYRHHKTLVEIKDGKVNWATGALLQTPGGAIVRLGEAGPKALAKVGKPESILYGCGKTSQQVNFYDSLGIQITVTDGFVTGLRTHRPK